MASNYWIKLYHEILDDPKMGRMPEILFARCVKIFLIAGENNKDGVLPALADMAWRLRLNSEELESDLYELQKVGIVNLNDGVWTVCKFSDRQRAMTPAEKMRNHRERKQKRQYYQPVTNGNADIEEDIEEEEDITPASSDVPFPQTPLEAKNHPDIKVFYSVSGVIPGFDDYGTVIDSVRYLKNKHPDDTELESYLLPFWLEWSRRKTKDGKPYSRTNVSWLADWAVNNTVPNKNEQEKVAVNSDGSMYV